MLAQAAAKQCYAELREADVMEMLAQDGASWQLILAADVLCYFGDLRDVLARVHERLDVGAWLVFPVEELLQDKDGALNGSSELALQRHGRYAHALDYVERTALAAGFAIRTLERQTLRYEADALVAGLFVVLEREGRDG
jgi:predicted TPR repeat methyltransferase